MVPIKRVLLVELRSQDYNMVNLRTCKCITNNLNRWQKWPHEPELMLNRELLRVEDPVVGLVLDNMV